MEDGCPMGLLSDKAGETSYSRDPEVILEKAPICSPILSCPSFKNLKAVLYVSPILILSSPQLFEVGKVDKSVTGPRSPTASFIKL